MAIGSEWLPSYRGVNGPSGPITLSTNDEEKLAGDENASVSDSFSEEIRTRSVVSCPICESPIDVLLTVKEVDYRRSSEMYYYKIEHKTCDCPVVVFVKD